MVVSARGYGRLQRLWKHSTHFSREAGLWTSFSASSLYLAVTSLCSYVSLHTVAFGRTHITCYSQRKSGYYFNRQVELFFAHCLARQWIHVLRQFLRGHLGSRAISVQVNTVAVSAHVFHSSLLVSCSLCLHIFAFSRSLFLGPMSQARVVDASGTPVLNSPMQVTSSDFGPLNAPNSDLDGIGTRSGSTTDEILDALLSKFVHITKTLGDLRLDSQRWNRISRPSKNTCVQIRNRCSLWLQRPRLGKNALGHSDGSTATGSLGSRGPASSDENRNTRRRLDTFSSPEDEHARSAVFLRFPSEQHHTGNTNWINNIWEKSNKPAYNKPIRIHCNTGSRVSQTRIRNKSQMSGLCGPIQG